MATASAARSVFRSASVRSAAARLGGGAKPARSAFSSPIGKSPLSNRFFSVQQNWVHVRDHCSPSILLQLRH